MASLPWSSPTAHSLELISSSQCLIVGTSKGLCQQPSSDHDSPVRPWPASVAMSGKAQEVCRAILPCYFSQHLFLLLTLQISLLQGCRPWSPPSVVFSSIFSTAIFPIEDCGFSSLKNVSQESCLWGGWHQTGTAAGGSWACLFTLLCLRISLSKTGGRCKTH